MNEPLNSSNDVLSQNEVEHLLAQVRADDFKTTVIRNGGVRESRKPEEIQPFDFRQPAFLAPSELRKIRLRHEQFIRSLAAHLSIYLRLDFNLQMSKLQTLTYQKLIENLPNPTHVSLFKAEPLKGICLLEVPPQLGLTLVDRLLGGPAHSVNGNRDLSDIEAALLAQVVQIMLHEWCNEWHGIQDLRPVILGHESHGRFLHTAAYDTVMLAVMMEAKIGDCVEEMQLAFPYYTIEPLVRQINDLSKPDRDLPDNDRTKPTWNPQFDDVQVEVSAGWRGLEMTARQLSSLKVGDVLAIQPERLGQVEVRLAGLPKFSGRLGTTEQKWAVELAAPL